MSLAPRIHQFEQKLDAALAALESVRDGGPEVIFNAAHIAELGYSQGKNGEALVDGLQVIAPAVIGGDPAAAVPTLATLEDLLFATSYWHLRECLYYSYNAPGTIDWEFAPGEVRIRYADPSLPRQFFTAANNQILDSIRLFEGRDDLNRIRALIEGTPEDAVTDAGQQAFALIEDEADTKLAAYFNMFEPGFDAPIEQHWFKELMEVCRLLLVKALWHRYHSTVNGTTGAVLIDFEELVDGFVQSSDRLDHAAASWALQFMSYGIDSRERGEEPLYFSLYRLPPEERLLMLPHDFCTWESFVSLLRLIALRDPDGYLRHFSGPVGAGLNRRLAKAVEAAGFEARTDVSLRRYGPELPDIDLLFISHEPTLGLMVLICEVKSPLPPRWSKDQLRVLQPDSIAKSFSQLDRILDFIGTDAGAEFLRALLPDGLAGFDEFAVAVEAMVITSDNAGAFFTDQNRVVVDFRTLERLLRRCDGDILYLRHALHDLGRTIDDCIEMVEREVEMGDTTVHYEGVTVRKLLDFAQIQFRSVGLAEKMAEEMRAVGARPLDFLRSEEGADPPEG